MNLLKVRSAVPVLQPYNSLYLQARLWMEALRERIMCDSEIVSSRAARTGAPEYLTLYHYGSFDWCAFSLARQKRTVFVFHNVTEPKYLWGWNPLVAVRSIAATIQLFLLRKDLPWLAVSGFNRDVLRKKGFRSVAVVPCIVPEVHREAKTSGPTLLFVGRISPNKNVLQLLEWYEEVALGMSQPPRLIIVGSRKARCRYGRAFERKFLRLNRVYPLIWHREPLPYADLQRLYSSSWLYVSGSRHEGFAVPVMESISAGTPAVYLPCGGTESVLDGVGCVRAEADLPAAILNYLENSKLREELQYAQASFMSGLRRDTVGDSLAAALQHLGFRSIEAPQSVPC
jgi:glycosyltransferase involved in cell wall biosynthesis